MEIVIQHLGTLAVNHQALRRVVIHALELVRQLTTSYDLSIFEMCVREDEKLVP